jgi:hypothetical protein
MNLLGRFILINLFALLLPALAWAASVAAPVEKSGQTTSYTAGDDGALQKGAAWPTPRFTDNGDGTLTDKLTGLIWLKNANCSSFYSGDATGNNSRSWTNALTAAASLSNGFCGLTDGSRAGHWRIPTKKELESLIDFKNRYPALPTGHSFSGVNGLYWVSTTYADYPPNAWCVDLSEGVNNMIDKTSASYVLPVRGGQ